MTPTRVAHLGKYLPPVLGGMETSIYEICKSLASLSDTKIRLIGANTCNRSEHLEISPCFEISKLARITEVFSTPLLRGLKREIKEFNPQVIHLHLPNPYLSSVLQPQGRPLVVTYHCEILTYPALLKLYAPVLDATLKYASKIIATSEQSLEHSPYLQKHRNKCVVVPLGIQKNSSTLETESMPAEKIVLFVGRLVQYKGLQDLIRAMTLVDGKLLVAGTGPLLKELQDLTTSLGIRNKVIFLGAVSGEELENYYRKARVVALTSLDEREAFGMVLVEALSFGRPLLTTKIPSGVQFVNRDGVTGFQVEVGDVKAIARSITRLLTDQELWLKFSKQARQHFNDNFEISNVARAYRKIYDEVL